MLKPPRARKGRSTFRRHGHARRDPYAWLRDSDWQAVMRRPEVLDGAIRAHLEAENAYADAVLAPARALRRTLFRELKARIKEDDATVPAADGPWAYDRSYRAGGQHPIFRRRRRDGDAVEVLLDGDVEAAGEAFFRIAECRHSPDHRLLAYAVDALGSEYYTVRFRDLDGGRELEDRLPNASGDMAWANDGRTLLYAVLDAYHRPSRINRHRIGEDPTGDAVVYEEPEAGFSLELSKTESRRFILITGSDHATTEVRVIDADDPDPCPRLVAARDAGVRYRLSHHGDRFLVLTNAGDAEDFKIVAAPLATPGRARWRDIVPHRPGRLIRRMLTFRDWLVRLERADGLPRIVVRRLADGAEHFIAFDEEAFELALVAGYEFDTATLRFSYASPTTPERIYDYDMAGRTRVLRKEQEIPSGHDPSDYVARRLFAISHDAERVPVTVLHRRDTALDGSAPAVLYGYGSYGFATPAGFAANRISLVDRGFVYAIAHVRGGTERGYRWYRTGKLMQKRNTFLDFIAAAEHLIGHGITAKGRIVAHGGSAGGMLVGAVANMRPELFKAVAAEVPFVDVLTTICDASLPLTPPEWTEWGDPIESEEAYRYILSYSPYDNVRAQVYPHILALAGLTDPRVTYWEPAKWVARLREIKADDNMLLLKTNMRAGHGGAAGRFDRLEEVALVYAFILQAFGLSE